MLYSENKKRGFTLVELIVVLVILAILAALLIPALTGYIDKSKKDQVIAETRMLHEAVQTEMAEIYGSSAQWRNTDKGATTIASLKGTAIEASSSYVDSATLTNRCKEVIKLSEVPSLQAGTGNFFALINGKAKVYALIYNSGRGYLGVYFSDTQQYSAYKLGETTEYGVVSDLAYFPKYDNTLYHDAAVDLSYNDDSVKDPIAVYAWSCDGIRASLYIGEWNPPQT